MDTFTLMRSFRRIVELGGLGKAADDLNLSAAGLSKQLRALEAHLGTVLLQRTTRRMSLTATGQAYYERCCQLLDQLEALERSVHEESQQVSGKLRVNAPLSFALSTLAPLLAGFLREHPGVELDLVMEDRLVEAVSQGFDVSIRLAPALPDSSLIARQLASLRQVLCAAPAYLQRHGHPASLAELAGHAQLGYSLSQQAPAGPAQDARVTVNNSLMLRELLIAGLGIGWLPSFLADPALADGRLRQVLPDHADAPRQVYAVYPTSRHLLPRVRAFVDYLAEHLPAAMGSDHQP
ncbi:LysR family transcriptional regulator [Pseudomonas sp. 148P]|uniref:LysR family transcriptional regulator n=1 Tax=Pseudomonas ulcerans TaxID=3115852 RepID=A0ABU7HPQ5_9PSED|nr:MULTISPECIES: LysR family transcriptional regulator [unclassified Pseudomonas]MEE1921933.1 LysR family transcriptional regulator [Pseudomonas sp. 147P]MEE1933517.1 LysR family transcriptional regulator [Pseudomonas sp. 148P]